MKRIQRKRKRGWRMPENAVYVGRPTRWGNPFDWQDYVDQWTDEHQARQYAVDNYRNWLRGNIRQWTTDRDWILEHLEELRGYDLACWCPLMDKDGNHVPCHADVLIELLEKRKVLREAENLD